MLWCLYTCKTFMMYPICIKGSELFLDINLPVIILFPVLNSKYLVFFDKLTMFCKNDLTATFSYSELFPFYRTVVIWFVVCVYCTCFMLILTVFCHIQLWSSSLCSFFHPPVTYCLLGPNVTCLDLAYKQYLSLWYLILLHLCFPRHHIITLMSAWWLIHSPSTHNVYALLPACFSFCLSWERCWELQLSISQFFI